MPVHRRRSGFTLIELMVTVAVIVTMMLLALPSFTAFRQRSALRAGAEQATSFWHQARFEAAKRNSMVKVGFVTSGTLYCIGAATTLDPADATACNCTLAGACDVGRWPVDQTEWRGVSISGTPTLGGNSGVVVIEPKRTSLSEPADEGNVQLAGPATSQYVLNVRIDRFGRAKLCESSAAPKKMSDFIDRRCSP